MRQRSARFGGQSRLPMPFVLALRLLRGRAWLMTGVIIDHKRHFTVRPTHFQVFGERRTGTNFLHHLLDVNLDLNSTTRYGWKHGGPTMPCIAKDALIVVVMRDPIGWLSSLHNRAFAKSHEGLPFSEFLRREWYDEYIPKNFGHTKWGYGGMHKDRKVANQIDRHPVTGARFRNPFELRQVKTACFLGFLNRECNVAIVDYANVRKNPEALISGLSENFNVKRNGPLQVPERVGAPGKPRPRVAKDDIGEDDIRFIRESLDIEQEMSLGYAVDF